MSYDSWKTTDPADELLGSCPQSGDRLEDDEINAAMLGVDVDEYVANRARDIHYRRWVYGPNNVEDEDDEIPF